MPRIRRRWEAQIIWGRYWRHGVTALQALELWRHSWRRHDARDAIPCVCNGS